MKFISFRLKHLCLLFLPGLIWLFTNATINTHSHVLYNGIKISHAHPYDKNNTRPNQFPHHNHTKGELILLDLVSHPLILLVFGVAISVLSVRRERFILPYIVQIFLKEHYFVLNYHAPPVALR